VSNTIAVGEKAARDAQDAAESGVRSVSETVEAIADVAAGVAGGLEKAAEEAASAGGRIFEAFKEGFAERSTLDDGLSVVSTATTSNQGLAASDGGGRADAFLGSFFDVAKAEVEKADKSKDLGDEKSSWFADRYPLANSDKPLVTAVDAKAQPFEIEKPLFDPKEALPAEFFNGLTKGPLGKGGDAPAKDLSSLADLDFVAKGPRGGRSAKFDGEVTPVAQSIKKSSFDNDFGDDKQPPSFDLFT